MAADASAPKTSILFVCMGNICRSPTAEAVFRKRAEEAGLADRLVIDSAGTHAYHVGKSPDRRSREAAERRGIDMSGIRARKVTADDLETFDYVLAMDRDNLSILLTLHEEAEARTRPRLFLEFAGADRDEVPDPYYGGAKGFDHVLDLVERAVEGLLTEVGRRGSG